MLKTLLIVAFLILILYNLGAGLYYMITDKGQSNRTVRSLTSSRAASRCAGQSRRACSSDSSVSMRDDVAMRRFSPE